MIDRRRLEATVRGYVQGVGFRVWAARVASRLGLTGSVRNEFDGTVRVVAEGPTDDLEQLLAQLRSGPSGAVVSDVDVRWAPPTGAFDRFRITAGHHPGD